MFVMRYKVKNLLVGFVKSFTPAREQNKIEVYFEKIMSV